MNSKVWLLCLMILPVCFACLFLKNSCIFYVEFGNLGKVQVVALDLVRSSALIASQTIDWQMFINDWHGLHMLNMLWGAWMYQFPAQTVSPLGHASFNQFHVIANMQNSTNTDLHHIWFTYNLIPECTPQNLHNMYQCITIINNIWGWVCNPRCFRAGHRSVLIPKELLQPRQGSCQFVHISLSDASRFNMSRVRPQHLRHTNANPSETCPWCTHGQSLKVRNNLMAWPGFTSCYRKKNTF